MAKTQIPLLKRIQQREIKELKKEKDKTISYSQFSTFHKCNYRWALDYKEGKRVFKPSIAAVFGTAIHNTIQNYIDVMFNVSLVEADSIDTDVYFFDELVKSYKDTVISNNNEHFSTPAELDEFYLEGLAIVDYFKKHRAEHFGKKNWKLVGIEMPLVQPIHPSYPNIYLKGFIDLVLYNEHADVIKIFDIKTSNFGWKKDKEQKDKLKIYQILLYKEYFAKQYDIDVDQIEVEFFIVKRKLYENLDFPQKRIQTFNPASGKSKRRETVSIVHSFIESVFNENGSYKDVEHVKTVSKESCQYCPYSSLPQICNKNLG